MSVLKIAARELGIGEDQLFLAARIEDFFDSLEWLEFLTVLKEEIGPLPNETALKCETFKDLANAYNLPC
jgi:hypothetical protein